MAGHRRFELDEITNRPGTYFNPRTEVLIVVDDSPELDHEVFAGEDFEHDEWLLVSDETPIDEHLREELLERFQLRAHAGGSSLARGDEEEELDEDEEDEDELEPDEDDDLYE